MKGDPGAGQFGTGRPGRAMAGQDETYIVPQALEGAGQGACDIRKSSRLGERNSFRRNIDNLHRPGSLIGFCRIDGVRIGVLAGRDMPGANRRLDHRRPRILCVPCSQSAFRSRRRVSAPILRWFCWRTSSTMRIESADSCTAPIESLIGIAGGIVYARYANGTVAFISIAARSPGYNVGLKMLWSVLTTALVSVSTWHGPAVNARDPWAREAKIS